MRYIVIILWIACLGACNPDVKQKVTVNGKLTNYKGNKIYFEISGRDSLVKAELDSAGRFSACLELDEGTYVRLMNGKAAFPLYLAPGMKLRVEMVAAKIKNGEYGSVVFPEGINKETRYIITRINGPPLRKSYLSILRLNLKSCWIRLSAIMMD